jgi:hypothetical protein
MGAKEALDVYEMELVQALWDQAERRQTESPESLQIFVNAQSVGTMECESQATSEKVFQTTPSPTLIELRSSSGLPVGTLSPEPLKRTTAQFHAGNYVIELEVQPQQDKSMVHLRSRNLLTASLEAPAFHTPKADQPEILQSDPSPWSMLAVAAQVFLVAGVVFLVADRFFEFTNESNDNSQLVVAQDQQLQQVLQQLTALQKRLDDQSSVVSVVNKAVSEKGNSGMEVVSHQSVGQSTDSPLLQQKPQVLQEGILNSRPVWVRFKKGIDNSRREHFFKEVSAQDPAQMGGWYSFNLNVSNSQKPDEVLVPFSQRDDIEIITTSVVTRHVQVRFKKDIADNDVNGFFEEIRAKRGEPKDNWYKVNLALPEPVNPQEFIGELRSGKIIEKVKFDLNNLPSS